MAKINRVIDMSTLQDGDQIKSVEYNYQSGAQKSLPVGPRLIPIPVGAGWTTDASSVKALPVRGMLLAIYNNSGTAESVTTGNVNTITAQAIGAVDALGNVGVACAPNAYTNIAMGNNLYVITSSSDLIVYIIDDPTYIAQESK